MLLACMLVAFRSGAQYCTPGSTNNGAGDQILNVTFAGINNSTGATGVSGYNDYTATVAAASVIQGASYPASMTINNGGTEYGGIWIDWDQNQVFDASEFVSMGSGANPTVLNQTIMVPITAVPGTTHMRVRSKYGSALTGADACAGYTYGETEDYLVDVVATSACAGTPVAGTASAVSAVCPGTSFGLSLTGYTLASGITIQWEESPAGAGTFAAITGATNSTYTVASITAATDYRATITCTNGGGSDVSNVITVNVNSFLNCYCSSHATTTADEEILNVTLGGTLNNSSTCATAGPPPNSVASEYSDYTSTVPAATVAQGDAVPFSVQVGTCGTGTYSNGVKIFIDYNQNGLFTDPGEEVYASAISTSGAHFETGIITVPVTATVGTTRMRVVNQETGTPSGITPCGTYGYGETEDYLVDVVVPTPCSGNPVAGTASGPSGVCANTAFTLSLSGYSAGQSGITIQWEESPAGASTWSAISGATSPFFTNPGITSDMDYHAVVTCSNGGGTDVSNTVTVSMNPFYNCYCSPLTGNPLASFPSNYVTNVTIPGTTLNNSTSSAGPGGYTQYDPTVVSNTATLTQGVTYALNVNMSGTGYTPGVWIDYDQNGTFDASEFIAMTPYATGTPSTALLTIPLTATPGLTGMRVRGYYLPFLATDACGNPGGGEAEDYVITIDPAIACSGTPTAGTASGPANICPNNPFTLTLSGNSTGLGIDIQWEESPSGAGSWTAISGATNSFYTNSGINTDMDYRATLTCNNGGATDVSNVVTVAVNSFYTCYCTSNLGGATGNSIDSVSISGTTLANGSAGTAPGYYTSYPATGSTTATLQQGVTYTINTIYSAGSISSLWIDYDHSGTFDASEWTQLTTNASSASINFTVPMSSLTGLTGMRIRTRGAVNNNGAADACSTFGSGETEDYVITIDPATACSGTPVAGTASGPASICSGVNYTLAVTGYTVGTGISLQWESSPAGAGTFTAISGATDATYVTSQTAATDYHVVITCANGGASATSNDIAVGMNSFVNCYCTSMASSTGDEEILNVTVGALNNSSTCTSTGGPGSIQNRYSDYTTVVPAGSLAQGAIVPFSIQVGTCGGNYGSGTGIFIDFNQNGSFSDPGEDVYVTASTTVGPHFVTGNITIPVGATLGTTRMRVINAEGYSGSGLTPCLAYGYGETEDYLVDVTAPAACQQPLGLSATNVTVTGADVSWGAVSGAAGYEYAVTTSSTPPASGTATTNTTESVTSLSGSTTYYLHVRTDCGSGSYSAWSSLSFQTLLANDNASGAILLTVGASCSGSPYFNTGATQSVGEPAPSCAGSLTGYQTVWYSFVAPASGAVKVSNDFAGGTMGADTRMALFSATDPNDYTTFTMLSCDDDNGVVVGARSILYGTGLTPGNTYYIETDGYSSGTIGTFCLEVTELNSSMLASSGSCTSGNSISNATGYSGWRSLVDNSGNLIANVKDQSGLSSGFSVNVTKNTGPVRADGSLYYLDRNYKINLTSGTSTNFDVQFFFTDAELAALQAVDPNATLANLNATRQTGTTCQANFAVANGTSTLLAQTGNGAANGADWITVNTPGFSNFYIMGGTVPLNIELKNISAINDGPRNRVDWTTGNEQKGDYFEVERSADGHNFTKVGEVIANGKASSYSFWDQTPVTGVNYYRLKLMTASGASSYSKVVTATVSEAGSFNVEVYPNPVSDQLTVSVYGQQGTNPSVSICDVTGKVLRVVELSGSSVSINMGSMAQGMYLIKYSDANHSQTIKVNKQ